LIFNNNPLQDFKQTSIENDSYLQKSLATSNLFINNYNTQNFYTTPFTFPQFYNGENNLGFNTNTNPNPNSNTNNYNKPVYENRQNKFKTEESDYFPMNRNFV
jgi:hypothetical protein